ncbi:hypothetical protein GM921_00215 [Pedobacter sp. LMG 31464]|uniref:Uncharacterized protein n=1 Tax=Pedobacter planticolens TaxID=2679964 RepID=A0A923ITP7_9SPHI|nr:hypothetical protein [Pedobacter planticolens]MBB2143893.1 hypothetical protein [Pedobacter planticolens]
MKISEDLQKLIPFGYLFLVVMGILKESVLFYQLGINILKYSTIMDILISPIATLTTHPITFLTTASVFVTCYYLPSILYKYDHNKWVRKIFELKQTKIDLPEIEIKKYYFAISIKSLAIGLLSIYLGYGSAEGFFISKKIKTDQLKYDYTLNYNSGETEQIFLVSTNSVYYFYLAKGNKAIKIAPIAAIKNMEITKNRMFK